MNSSSRDHAPSISGGAGTPAPPITWEADIPSMSTKAQQSIHEMRLRVQAAEKGLRREQEKTERAERQVRDLGLEVSRLGKLVLEMSAKLRSLGHEAPRPTVADGDKSRDESK